LAATSGGRWWSALRHEVARGEWARRGGLVMPET